MKLKKAKIIIQSVDSIKGEWKNALKGNSKSIQKSGEIVFTGIESVAKVFSKTRLKILQIIIAKSPKSIYELSKLVDRDFKNVHSDVKFLEEVGLIELQEVGDARNGLRPIAKYSGIELDLAA